MSIVFNADEIFNIAVQIEKNGAAFYKKAASGAKSAAIKDKLLSLADMEIDHEATFEGMRKQLKDSDKAKTAYDPNEETQLYLNAFAKGHVFNIDAEPAKELTGNETPREILQKAIGLEKDSIVFYLGIKDMVPPNLGKDKIDGIIAQEMGHVRLLSKELDSL
jgi:rubrerythrin